MEKANSLEVKICDICGANRFQDRISACFKCKISYEHDYCRRSYPQNTEAEWYCDDCLKVASPKNEKGGLEITLVSKSSAGVYGQGPSSRPYGVQQQKKKSMAARKVKYIPVDEALKLQSGLLRKDSTEKTANRFNLSPSEIGQPMVILTPVNNQTHSDIQQKENQRAHDAFKGKKVQFVESVAGHQVRGDLDTRASEIKNSAMKGSSSWSYDTDNNDKSADEMEINMTAGKDVGRIDAAVPKGSPSESFSDEDYPPGFEDMIRQRMLTKFDSADDMKIDMVAGEDVGSTDVVVRRGSPSGSNSSDEDYPPGFEDMIRQGSLGKFDSADDMEIDMVAGEDVGITDVVVRRGSPSESDSGDEDFPPGFEDMIRQGKLGKFGG